MKSSTYNSIMPSAEQSPACPPSRALPSIVLGGLAAALGDFLFAVTYYGVFLGIKQIRIFQSVASGLLGRPAFNGGMNTYVLGLFLHVVVGLCIATVFYLITKLWPAILRRPFVTGPVYGMIAYLVMNYVVLPLSAIHRVPKFVPSSFAIEMIGHALLVGLPIALIARWAAKRAGGIARSHSPAA
jgi:hypothetical protein